MSDDERIRLDLTDEEWMQLLDGASDDSQLQACCANISALRDEFMSVVRQGRHEPLMVYQVQYLKQKLKWVADGHDLTPLLQKVCDQLGFDPAEAEHEARPEV